MNTSIEYRDDPHPTNTSINRLRARAWNDDSWQDYSAILSRSLAHVGAFDGMRLIGFVNVAWDGGIHAFILDTCVDPDFRRQGIATRLVKRATSLARDRGAKWLHVDFEPHLTGFHRNLGFSHTEAGLLSLRD